MKMARCSDHGSDLTPVKGNGVGNKMFKRVPPITVGQRFGQSDGLLLSKDYLHIGGVPHWTDLAVIQSLSSVIGWETRKRVILAQKLGQILKMLHWRLSATCTPTAAPFVLSQMTI